MGCCFKTVTESACAQSIPSPNPRTCITIMSFPVWLLDSIAFRYSSTVHPADKVTAVNPDKNRTLSKVRIQNTGFQRVRDWADYFEPEADEEASQFTPLQDLPLYWCLIDHLTA